MTDLLATRPPLSEPARAFLSRSVQPLLIGGEWRQAASGGSFNTLDPATGKRLGAIARGQAEDVDRAVAAARKAFETGGWPAMLPMARAQLLWRIADLIEANIDELAELETLDQNRSHLHIAGLTDVI